jgi:hypothetical protein
LFVSDENDEMDDIKPNLGDDGSDVDSESESDSQDKLEDKIAESAGSQSSSFQHLLDLAPGEAISMITINSIIKAMASLLLHLDAESKQSLLADIKVLFLFMDEKIKGKKKSPKAEVIEWLNTFGPLVILKSGNEVAQEHGYARLAHFAILVSEEDGTEIELLLPRNDVIIYV